MQDYLLFTHVRMPVISYELDLFLVIRVRSMGRTQGRTQETQEDCAKCVACCVLRVACCVLLCVVVCVCRWKSWKLERRAESGRTLPLLPPKRTAAQMGPINTLYNIGPSEYE